MATEQQRKFGYCECGCGQKTRPAPQTHTKQGWTKGEPVRYVPGHARRGKRMSSSSIHQVGDVLEVSLSRGRGITLVDAADEAIVAGRRWRLRGTYVVTEHPAVCLHHLILGRPPLGLVSDHRNGDRLDNRRTNLRFVDVSLNNFNRHVGALGVAGFPGVVEMSGRFRASINYRNRFLHLGMFDSVAEAARTRVAAELEYFGEIGPRTAAALGQMDEA